MCVMYNVEVFLVWKDRRSIILLKLKIFNETLPTLKVYIIYNIAEVAKLSFELIKITYIDTFHMIR